MNELEQLILPEQSSFLREAIDQDYLMMVFRALFHGGALTEKIIMDLDAIIALPSAQRLEAFKRQIDAIESLEKKQPTDLVETERLTDDEQPEKVYL